MKQNIVQMPESADFKIDGNEINIKNYKPVIWGGLFGVLVKISGTRRDELNPLSEFEKYNISYELVIECCVEELEEDAEVLTKALAWWYCSEKKPGEFRWNDTLRYSKSAHGRNTADLVVEKIRSCSNWQELHSEIDYQSVFARKITKLVKREIKR